jgi:hypothetical protein
MDPNEITEELEHPGARNLLESATLLRLAYNESDGFPRVIPIGFYWNGNQIVACTAATAPKVKALSSRPNDRPRRVVSGVVGEGTLRDLVREAKANDQAFRQRVRTVLRASYSSHYRRLLPRLLAALGVRCANTRHRPAGCLRR